MTIVTIICVTLWLRFHLQDALKSADTSLMFEGKIDDSQPDVNVVMNCSSQHIPFECHMEFLHGNSTVESIRYNDGECYDKFGKCKPRVCSCSKDCTSFHWNFTTASVQTNDSFGCKMRIHNYTSNSFYKVYTIVVYNGTDFTTVTSVVNPGKTKIPNTVHITSGFLTEVIAVSVSVFVFGLVVVSFCFVYFTRKKDPDYLSSKEQKHKARNSYSSYLSSKERKHKAKMTGYTSESYEMQDVKYIPVATLKTGMDRKTEVKSIHKTDEMQDVKVIPDASYKTAYDWKHEIESIRISEETKKVAVEKLTKYIDYVLSVNKPHFIECLLLIYPSEFEINDSSVSKRSASYLEPFLDIDTHGRSQTRIYEERDDFNFPIVNFPFRSRNIPSALSYIKARKPLISTSDVKHVKEEMCISKIKFFSDASEQIS